MDYERDMKNIFIGDRITVKTLKGVKGNIIGRLPDGRMVLFNRDSPYRSMLAPDQSVDCSVNYVSERYVARALGESSMWARRSLYSACRLSTGGELAKASRYWDRDTSDSTKTTSQWRS